MEVDILQLILKKPIYRKKKTKVYIKKKDIHVYCKSFVFDYFIKEDKETKELYFKQNNITFDNEELYTDTDKENSTKVGYALHTNKKYNTPKCVVIEVYGGFKKTDLEHHKFDCDTQPFDKKLLKENIAVMKLHLADLQFNTNQQNYISPNIIDENLKGIASAIDFVKKRFGEDIKTFIFGECFGGTLAIQYAQKCSDQYKPNGIISWSGSTDEKYDISNRPVAIKISDNLPKCPILCMTTYNDNNIAGKDVFTTFYKKIKTTDPSFPIYFYATRESEEPEPGEDYCIGHYYSNNDENLFNAFKNFIDGKDPGAINESRIHKFNEVYSNATNKFATVFEEFLVELELLLEKEGKISKGNFEERWDTEFLQLYLKTALRRHFTETILNYIKAQSHDEQYEKNAEHFYDIGFLALVTIS